MECINCHRTITSTAKGFIVCPYCQTVNFLSSEGKHQPIVLRGTAVSPVHHKRPVRLGRAKQWSLGAIAVVILIVTGLGANFARQNSSAKADLQLAKQEISQGKYDQANTLLTKAGKLPSLSSTKRAISQQQTQNQQWQTDAAKLAQAGQLAKQDKLDAATALLNQIGKAFPTYAKVTGLQKTVQAQKAADIAKLAAAQPKPVLLPPAPASKPVPAPHPAAAAPAPFTTPIQIRGDAACQSDTMAALQLLSAKAPTHYATVTQYIGIIQCASQGSGMYAYDNPPLYLVGDVTRNAGTVWYAGTIAHDAGHSKLYHDYLSAHPGQPVPDDVWTGQSAEITCLAAQYDALSKIGGTPSQLTYVQNVINTQYYNVPYDQRWW